MMQKLLTDDYAYADEEVFSNPEAPTESVRMMEVKDLLVVEKVYNDAKKQINKLKSDLTKYTKELFETVNGNTMEVSK